MNKKITLTRGERFKDARTVHNKNGKEKINDVTNKTLVSGSCISDLENDDKDREVSYNSVKKLAAHYGVSVDYLLGFSDIPNTTSDSRAASVFTGLSEETVLGLHDVLCKNSVEIGFIDSFIRYCGLHGETLQKVIHAVECNKHAYNDNDFSEDAYHFSQALREKIKPGRKGAITLPDGVVPLRADHATEFYIDCVVRDFRSFLSDFVNQSSVDLKKEAE